MDDRKSGRNRNISWKIGTSYGYMWCLGRKLNKPVKKYGQLVLSISSVKN